MSSLYNLTGRLSFVGTLTLTCLAAVALAMAFSGIAIDLAYPPTPSASFTVTASPLMRTDLRLNNGTVKPIDRIVLYVNGTVDLTSCFNWNTKQLFVMFVAEYKNSKFVRNELNLIDFIVKTPADAVLTIAEPSAKYPLDDIVLNQLADNPSVVVKVKYHAMTLSGWSPLRELTEAEGGIVRVPMPSEYRRQPGISYR